MSKERNGGRVLIDQLALNDAELIFGVPGESYLAALDALHDSDNISFIVCRQEGGAAMMAEAYGKITGRPGIAFVTRGPGAANASAGIHIAYQDSTPMILLIGQIGRGTVERDAFQEIDYRRMFGQMTKWVAEIDAAARIPEFIHRAYVTAMSGRPGPVVLALPEDMLADQTTVEDGRAAAPVPAYPSPRDVRATAERLDAAERPLIIVGGSGWSARSGAALQQFADENNIPVAAGFRRQDLIDNQHRCYAGDLGIGANPKLVEMLNRADYWLVIGSRLGEMTSNGYQRFDLPVPQRPMTHVLSGVEELGRVYQPDHMIVSAHGAFAEALLATGLLPDQAKNRLRADWLGEARAAYDAYTAPPRIPGALQMGEVMAYLNECLPINAIITNGAGNYTAWPNRFFRYRGFRTMLAPTSGSMGYGLPAAIAAALHDPQRPVICFAGDGCLMMTVQEIATAAQYRTKIRILVVNNGMYGTIRMHQERAYPKRVSGTYLQNPDFTALGRSFGIFAATVETSSAFRSAFQQAMDHDGPALIELKIDPEVLTPQTTLSDTRAHALARG